MAISTEPRKLTPNLTMEKGKKQPDLLFLTPPTPEIQEMIIQGTYVN